VRILRLDETGHFVEWMPEEEGILRSATVEGFWLREEWLWHGVGEFPSSAAVIREIRGLDKTLADIGTEAIVEHLPTEEALAALRRKLGPEAFARLLRRWLEENDAA
jgi:hypothetical protein